MINHYVSLLDKVSEPGPGHTQSVQLPAPAARKPLPCTLRCTLAAEDKAFAVVLVDMSEDGKSWSELLSINMAGPRLEIKESLACIRAPYVRGRVAMLSGTNATISLILGR